MLLIILAVLWIAVLAPTGFRRLRDRQTNHSIEAFHSGYESLSHRGEYVVDPAYKLYDEGSAQPPPEPEEEITPRLPRLRLVAPNETAASLAREMSWAEWSESMADDPFERVAAPAFTHRENHTDVSFDDDVAPVNPAVAYSRPMQQTALSAERHFDTGPDRGARDQRRRRRNFVLGLLALAILDSLAAFALSSTMIIYSAAAFWFAWLSYLALMFVAMQRGMIASSRVTRSTTAPRSERYIEAPAASYEETYDNEFYEPETAREWPRQARYASGQ